MWGHDVGSSLDIPDTWSQDDLFIVTDGVMVHASSAACKEVWAVSFSVFIIDF